MKLCKLVKPVPLVLTANTVPLPELPPIIAVPYSVLPTKIKSACGPTPSLLVEFESAVKLCTTVKPVPLVFMANTVPLFALPPLVVVPYRVLPDKINPARGLDPSLEPARIWRIV